MKTALKKIKVNAQSDDANQLNVLVKNEEVSGIIDFGNLAYTQLINELAIAIAYAC